jgi:uncharacterized membrane protein HdeD (DUF308 family)
MTEDSIARGLAAGRVDIETVARSWGWFLGLGIILVILGIGAISLPFATAMAVNLLVGWLLIAGGAVHLVHAVKAAGWRGGIRHVLCGLLQLVVGVYMVTNPVAGVFVLTIMLVAYFAVEGVFKIILAVRTDTLPQRGWVTFSGIVSLGLAIYVGAQFPMSALWVIGLLVGIEMVVSGWSFIMIALATRGKAAADDQPVPA